MINQYTGVAPLVLSRLCLRGWYVAPGGGIGWLLPLLDIAPGVESARVFSDVPLRLPPFDAACHFENGGLVREPNSGSLKGPSLEKGNSWHGFVFVLGDFFTDLRIPWDENQSLWNTPPPFRSQDFCSSIIFPNIFFSKPSPRESWCFPSTEKLVEVTPSGYISLLRDWCFGAISPRFQSAHIRTMIWFYLYVYVG